MAHHASGEIFLAFAARGPADRAADRTARVADRALDPLCAATVEATEEAVLNALWRAVDTTGRDGRTARALPRDEVLAILAAHRPPAP